MGEYRNRYREDYRLSLAQHQNKHRKTNDQRMVLPQASECRHHSGDKDKHNTKAEGVFLLLLYRYGHISMASTSIVSPGFGFGGGFTGAIITKYLYPPSIGGGSLAALSASINIPVPLYRLAIGIS